MNQMVANRLSLCNVQTGLFPGQDQRATWSSSSESRSESVIAINPQNESNMVGASKKFIDPSLYHFKLGPVYTFDGGDTGEPLVFSSDIVGQGMSVYKSSDGGQTWSQPTRLTTTTSDDKQWVLCDNNPGSPHYGNVYVCWAASSPLRFARSLDHGATWKGKGQDPPGTTLVSSAFAPDISISPDGTLHIFWHDDGGTTISYLRSTDGGATFGTL